MSNLEKPNFATRLGNRVMAQAQRLIIYRGTASLRLVWQILYQKITETNLHQQASAVAFSFTLSLFPTLLFLFSLIPFIAAQFDAPNLTRDILELLSESVPKGIYEFIAPTISDILQNPRTDVLSFGFLFALYAATGGVAELIHTFNMNYKHSEKQTFIRKRLLAASLAFIFAFLLIVAVVLLLVGDVVFHFLNKSRFFNDQMLYVGLLTARYAVTFMVFYFGIAYIYYIAPAVRRSWRFLSPGAAFAALGGIMSTNAFSYYLSNFTNYNKLYGSIGTIIGLMVWFYVLAWVLLIGFSWDAARAEAKIAYEAQTKDKFDLLQDIEDTDMEYKISD